MYTSLIRMFINLIKIIMRVVNKKKGRGREKEKFLPKNIIITIILVGKIVLKSTLCLLYHMRPTDG